MVLSITPILFLNFDSVVLSPSPLTPPSISMPSHSTFTCGISPSLSILYNPLLLILHPHPHRHSHPPSSSPFFFVSICHILLSILLSIHLAIHLLSKPYHKISTTNRPFSIFPLSIFSRFIRHIMPQLPSL